MTTAIKRRRGTTAQHSTFTGLEGEITVDTTKDTLVVHDGATAGGFALLREDLSNNTNVASTSTAQTFTNKTFGDNPTFSAGTANGVAYLNGSKVLTTGSALTFDGTTFTSGAHTLSTGNLNFGGAAQRITGNFSAASADRVAFQNSTTNGNTQITAITNGTGNSSNVDLYNSSDLSNASIARFGVSASEVWIRSNVVGTGAFLPITFYTNGSEQMRLTSTGLGIGTSSPSAKLNVVSSGTTGGQIIAANSSYSTTLSAENGYSWLNSNGAYPLIFGTNGSERMRIDSSGKVGIGTSSPAVIFDVTGSGLDRLLVDPKSAGGGVVLTTVNNANSTYAPYTINGSVNIFQTGGTERMRIDSSGNLLVGTTSTLLSNRKLNVDGGINVSAVFKSSSQEPMDVWRAATSGTLIEFAAQTSYTTVGTISTNGTTTAYNTTSDYRLKENIQPMQNALGVVAQLNPVTYTWKADGSDGQGFIAHELQAVVPDCVTGEKDAVDEDGNPVYQGIDTSFLVATLTKAIQELKAELDATKAEVAALKGV